MVDTSVSWSCGRPFHNNNTHSCIIVKGYLIFLWRAVAAILPTMKPSPDREIQIGQRLRAFREGKRISRTAFALSIGIGSERLASYEAGRVPLRFEVFKAINDQYFISPRWLATGEGSPALSQPFHTGDKALLIPMRSVFSEAYDAHLAPVLRDRSWQARVEFEQYREAWQRLAAFFNANPEEQVPPEVIQAGREGLEVLRSDAVAGLVEFDESVKSRLARVVAGQGRKEKANILLTASSEFRKVADMKSGLQELLGKVRRLTEGKGMKAKLAKCLGVPQSRISEWLAGKYEPSGEITLRLLHWVEQQEPQPNTPGSITITAKGKTQIGKSSYEKPTQVRKKG